LEELEEGEIVDCDPKSDNVDGSRREQTPASSPKKSVKTASPSHRALNGRELEEGELVSSDEDETENDKVNQPVSGHINPPAIQNNRERRGAENKENRVDKKKKGLIPKILCFVGRGDDLIWNFRMLFYL